MFKMLKVLALLLALVVSPQAHCQALWGKSAYGMTLSQVKEAYPEAVTADSPGTLHGGAKGTLTIQAYEVVNKKFNVIFYFKNDKLEQVVLACEKQSTFHSAMLVFDAVSDVLKAKYGPEISKDVKRGTLNMANAVWLSGKTNISLIAMSVGDADAMLNINYQVRISKDADKL